MRFRLTPHIGQQVLDRGQRRARWQHPVVDQPKDRQASTLAGTSRPFCVHTGDGARIAVGALGDGPGLVMVHGSIADHTTFDSSISALAHDLTIFAMGRRGFGASPDGQQTQSGGHSGSTGVIQLLEGDENGQMELVRRSLDGPAAGAAATRIAVPVAPWECGRP